MTNIKLLYFYRAMGILFGVFCFLSGASQTTPQIIIDPKGHTGVIHEVLFLKGGKQLLSVSEDKSIRIWDLATAEVNKTLYPFRGNGSEGKIYAAALSPNQKFLATGGFFSKEGGEGKETGTIKIIDLDKGEIIAVLKGHENAVNDLAFTPSGEYLISASADHKLLLWDADFLTGQKHKLSFEGHQGAVNTLAISPDGKQLTSAGADGKVLFWTIPEEISSSPKVISENKEGKLHLDEVTSLGWLPDGSGVVSAGKDRKIIRWTAKGHFLREIDRHKEPVLCFTIDPSGQYLIAFNRNARIYDLSSGEKLGDFESHTNSVGTASFAPFTSFAGEKGTYIASAGGDDKNILLWRVEDGGIVRNFAGKGKSVFAVGISNDGRVAFGNDNPTGILEDCPLQFQFDFKELRLDWRIPQIKEFQKNRISFGPNKIYKASDQKLTYGNASIMLKEERDGIIRSYTFLPGSDQIAVGATYSLKIFHRQGELIKTLTGHTGEVWALATEDNFPLVSGGNDQTVRFWNAQSGELLASLFATQDKEWIIWSPEGYYAASAGGEKYVGWLLQKDKDKLGDFLPVSAFRKTYLRPDVIKHVLNSGSFLTTANALQLNTKEDQQDEVLALAPVVKWESPQQARVKATASVIKLKALVTSDIPLTSCKVMVNNKPAKILEAELAGNTSIILEMELDLGPYQFQQRGLEVIEEDDENQLVSISIFAANDIATIVSETLEIEVGTQPAPVKRESSKDVTTLDKVDDKPKIKSTLHLVTIGVSKFENSQYNLNYADADAIAIKEVFANQKGKLFNEVNTIDIHNERATRKNILNAFHYLKETVQPQDMVILFVASHGLNKDGDFFILPYDGQADKAHITCINWNDFAKAVGNLPSQTLLFIDACYSGQLGNNLGHVTNNTEAIRSLSSQEYGVVIMAASTGAETSLEHKDWAHGAFTLSLLEGLKEGKADLKPDGTIYLRELDFYVHNRVIELTGGRQHPTTQKPSSISVMPILNWR